MASCYTMNFLQMALTSNISLGTSFFSLLSFGVFIFISLLTDFFYFSFRIYFPWSSVENKMFYYFRNFFSLDIFFYCCWCWFLQDGFVIFSFRFPFLLKKVFKVKFCSSNSCFFFFLLFIVLCFPQTNLWVVML